MMFLWGGNGCGTVYIGKISLKLKPVYKLPLIWPFVKIVVTEIPKRGGVSEAVFWLAIADCLISFVGTRVRHRTIYLDYRISIIQLFGKALRVFHNRDSSGLLIAYKCLLWCYFSGLSWAENKPLVSPFDVFCRRTWFVAFGYIPTMWGCQVRPIPLFHHRTYLYISS